MSNKKVKILLIVEQCNPDWASVPLVGYKFFQEISKIVEVTLVTHERNREALEKRKEYENIVYIAESALLKKYYRLVEKFTYKDKVIWPLYLALTYPIYAEFNHRVYEKFKQKILNREYDLVHAITPMMPRYPVKIVKVCNQVPFLLGPVNGGVPFPAGFKETARKEHANLNFLRAFGRVLVSGYAKTYREADRILVGSTFTLNLLKDMFTISDRRISLFYENGISKEFLVKRERPRNNSKINLLFVGRLAAYKCADLVIEAVSKLDPVFRDNLQLTIVGDGSERNSLEKLVLELELGSIVSFIGWVSQQETFEYYSKANIFCFPSVREFGGAVVLEAMACGLPCIVANNGGVAEYVTEETGFRIEPISREYLMQELIIKITVLIEDEKLWKSMSEASIQRAREFEWEHKAEKVVKIYEEMLFEKSYSF